MCRLRAPEEVRVHFIEADFSLANPWLEDFVTGGIAELEAFLAKHAAFLDWLADS